MTALGCITVAGFRYGIFNNSKYPLVFETGFEDFLSKQTEGIHRQLFFFDGFISLPNNRPIYQAKIDQQILWEIIEYKGDRWFLVYDPYNGNLQQQAQYNRRDYTWRIYCETQHIQGEAVFNPLAYPMAPLIWYVLSTEEDLLLIHASGLVQSDSGRIFAGFSGVGKSTLAEIWQRNGAQLINDDRLILKKEENGSWSMHNTPMYYRALPAKGPLTAIYLPFHSPQNSIQILNGAMSIANLLAFTIHHGYDPQHLLHHSLIAEQLVKDVPIAKLGVVPTDAIIDFIKANEQNAS